LKRKEIEDDVMNAVSIKKGKERDGMSRRMSRCVVAFLLIDYYLFHNQEETIDQLATKVRIQVSFDQSIRE